MAKEKFKELVKKIRLEISEAVVAEKDGENVIARACLLHAKRLLDGFLRKAYKNEKDSKVDSA